MIELSIEDPKWQVSIAEWAEEARAAVLAHLALDPGFTVSVLACDDARIAELNAEFRGKPTPTNVLSWPAQDRAAGTPGAMPALPGPPDPWDAELGDIAIAYGVCAAEAQAQGKPFEAHVRHLLVHGMLHLLGFDHETDADAGLMERLEAEILAKQGLPNPYLDLNA